MTHRNLRLFSWMALAPLLAGGSAASAGDERGSQLLETIAGAPDRGLSVADARIVEQTPNPWAKEGMAPVWSAKVMKEGKESGHLMWATDAAGKLIEFSLGRTEAVAGAHCVEGVTNLQQFGVPGNSAAEVCSGCVPTAAANLVAFWSAHGFSQWGEFHDEKAATLPELQTLASRLRSLLKMQEIPDALGYTDDRRPLAGAMPEDLAAALRKDAAAHGVKAAVEFAPFSADRLRSEIAAGRPVLLTCVVRLPQKPELSWGHELTGVGWTEIAGDLFLAVHDNFYPAPEVDTRWIRSDAFESMITVLPSAW
jgi:hypothetical protein